MRTYLYKRSITKVNRRISIALFAMLISCLFLIFSSTIDATSQKIDLSNQTYKKLLTKASSGKDVRVIISFKADDKQNQLSSSRKIKFPGHTSQDNNQNAMTDGQYLAFSSKLKKQQKGILDKLKKAKANKVIKYKYVAKMALSVSQEDLITLLADDAIVVREDKAYKPYLISSVPLIYPTQDQSEFHGNNEWAVAILDSGVDKTHPFLYGKVVSEACFSNNNGAGSTTESLCPSNGLPFTPSISTVTGSGVSCSTSIAGCEHGTMLAGVVAGNSVNVTSGASYDGVARDAKLISVQVYSKVNDYNLCDAKGYPYGTTECAVPYSSDIVSALEHIYGIRNDFKIASVLIAAGIGAESGACDYHAEEKDIIDLLRSAGIATIIASGNDGSGSQLPVPACISSAITVGSTNNSDIMSTFSNHNSVVDLFAPGVGISSSIPGGGFDTHTGGTSIAAAHAAGAWAVMKNAAPHYSVSQIEDSFKSVGPLIVPASPQYDPSDSRRRIDISAALDTVVAAVVDDELCIPIKSKNGKIAVVCL